MKKISNNIALFLEDDPVFKAVIEGLLRAKLDPPSADFDKAIGRAIAAVIPAAASATADQLLKGRLTRGRKRGRVRRAFESRHGELWESVLESLELLSASALELGVAVNHRFRTHAAAERDFVFDVLVRVHARGVLTAGEVLCLLRGGYAGGAHARWRTLHELSVAALFIKKSGNDTAEQYLLHEIVESKRILRQYQDYTERLNLEPATPREVHQVKEAVDHLAARFGVPFLGEYGWAAQALNKPRPTFRDLELHVELDHLRPYYKLASHGVHAGPKGLLFNIARPKALGDIMLAGPSNVGLADPAHGTAISLHQLTTALATHYPRLEFIVMAKALERLVNEVGDRAIQVHRQMQRTRKRKKSAL